MSEVEIGGYWHPIPRYYTSRVQKRPVQMNGYSPTAAVDSPYKGSGYDYTWLAGVWNPVKLKLFCMY